MTTESRETNHGPTRRALLGGIATTLVAAPLATRPSAASAAGPDGAAEEVIALWPRKAPGAPAKLPAPTIRQQSKDPAVSDRWMSGVDKPTLTVIRPQAPNGTAVLLMPGGGYTFLSLDNEGYEQAQWLSALGVTCFILRYRLPAEGWARRALVPLQDAQRAMRVIRSRAADFGIDTARIAVIGFSAGGHVSRHC